MRFILTTLALLGLIALALATVVPSELPQIPTALLEDEIGEAIGAHDNNGERTVRQFGYGGYGRGGFGHGGFGHGGFGHGGFGHGGFGRGGFGHGGYGGYGHGFGR